MKNVVSGKNGITARISDVIVLILFAILLLVSALLSIGSLLMTSVVDVNEHITLVQDNVVLNLLVVAAFILVLKYCRRFFRTINPKTAAIVLIAYTSVLGVLWITASQAVPRADQEVVLNAAAMVANNDYTPFYGDFSYFSLLPHQLGVLFVFELFTRLFGSGNDTAFTILNIVWLDAVYIAIIYLVRLIFNSKKIELLTILLLFACLQPILFCTFIYGNLMGLAFSLWAVYFEIRYIKTNKKSLMAVSAAMITVAVLAKINCTIVLIAMCIILLLHFLKNHRWFNLAAIALAAIMSLGLFGLVQKSYEMRANVKFDEGITQVAWAAMGIQDESTAIYPASDSFPGWYNRYPIIVFQYTVGDTESRNAQVMSDIKTRVQYFIDNPAYAIQFFANKTISQWDEPSFESIWISQVPYNQAPPHPDWVNSLYYGDLNRGLLQCFDFYVEIIFIGFAAAMFFAIRKKQGICFFAIPLVVLGGFTYHFLFEAKSQYILVYFVMMVPFAAWGYYQLVNLKFEKRKPKEPKPSV